MERKKWVTKPKDERVKSILKVLNNYEEIFLIDLIRKHAEEIGVYKDKNNKIIHQVWDVVKSDCVYLAKIGEINIKKDENGKLILCKLNKDLQKETDEDKEYHKDKEIQKTYINEEIQEIKKSIEMINNKIKNIKNEILDIWKSISQTIDKSKISDLEKNYIIDTLQNLIDKLRKVN